MLLLPFTVSRADRQHAVTAQWQRSTAPEHISAAAAQQVLIAPSDRSICRGPTSSRRLVSGSINCCCRCCWSCVGLWESLLISLRRNACFIKLTERDGFEEKKMIVSQGNNRPQDKLCLRGHRNGYPVLHRSTLMTLAAGDGTGQTQLVVTDT